MICNENHSDIQHIMRKISICQGGKGRHRCAACAYERGYEDGKSRKEEIDIRALLNSLPRSQAQAQRHKSAHEAYVRGYYEGIKNSYK